MERHKIRSYLARMKEALENNPGNETGSWMDYVHKKGVKGFATATVKGLTVGHKKKKKG